MSKKIAMHLKLVALAAALLAASGCAQMSGWWVCLWNPHPGDQEACVYATGHGESIAVPGGHDQEQSNQGSGTGGGTDNSRDSD